MTTVKNGFQNVDPDTINDSSAIIEATHFFLSCAKSVTNKIQAIEQTIRDLQKQKEHEEQALFLFKEFLNGSKTMFFCEPSTTRQGFNFFRNLDMSYFATILAAHGLKITNKNTIQEDLLPNSKNLSFPVQRVTIDLDRI
jgi:hypothetical protein